MLFRFVVELLSLACCVALYVRVPGLRVSARRVLPFALAAIGVLGLLLALWSRSFAGQNPLGPAGTWRATIVAQSVAFLAAGLWLMRGENASRLTLTDRSGRPQWNLLLLPVLAVFVILWGPPVGHPGIVLLAAAVITLSVMIGLPAAAMDLAVAALAVLGLAGLVIAAQPPEFSVPIAAARIAKAVPGPDGGYFWAPVAAPPARIGTAGWPLDLLAAIQAAAILAFALWLVPRTVGVHARALLRPRPDPVLAGRVEQLTQTRADAVDSAAAELRRVERDLHDGAQARLVALGMNLRAAERLIHSSPAAAVALVAEARQASSAALTELRDLVRGIYPPVLADRGLGDAVRALALDTPIRTQTDIDLPGRPEFPVESACYFAVAEALANAAKHSGARLVQIRIRYSPDPRPGDPRTAGVPAAGLLRIEVTDNGTGGADPARGTGLAGIERRLGTLDGILAVSSPPGGPTMIIMEVPCALSSPKTSSC